MGREWVSFKIERVTADFSGDFFEHFLTSVKIFSAGHNIPMLYLNLCWGYPLMTVVCFGHTVPFYCASTDITAGKNRLWYLHLP